MTHPLTRVCGRVPFVVAHRAGNEVATLRRAEALQIPLVELDVHLDRERLEVRHLKRLGPIPVLWDRWRLAPGWNARLTLQELLQESAPDTQLMLDLKGGHPRLGTLVAAVLEGRATSAHVTVCSRWWRQLDPLRGFPASASCIRSAAVASSPPSRGASATPARAVSRCTVGSSTPRPWRGCASVPT